MNETAASPVVSDVEQSLCVRCGLCCDGTIFERARIFPADDLAQLAADGFILVTAAERIGFALPCHHHQDRICTVYQQGRPHVCHTFRCALLHRLEAGELSCEEALARIEHAVALAGRIQAQLPAQRDNERQSLKQRMAAWQQAQTAAGIDVRRTFTALLLDFASLQRILDQHFRAKLAAATADEMPAPATEQITAEQGADHE